MAKTQAEYTVVARRYRPRQFDDLIGQEPVAQALRNALTSGRVAHAYLFTGARGVGKTSTARILAKALNCVKGPTPTPCDKCSSCLAIANGDDIDVREIDGASNNGVDEIRALRQDVGTRPTRGHFKIYVIDEVHMLTPGAFNALLKTLEEPPAHVKFIFATTEVQKVPITILSRCQRFDFGTIRTERIAEQLRAIVKAEKMEADDEAIDIIARRGAGSMRDAQSLLDQLLAFSPGKLTGTEIQKLLGVAGPERVMALAEAIFRKDTRSALEQVGNLSNDGLQLGELLDQIIDHWRDLMLLACAGKDVAATGELNTPARFHAALFAQAESTSLDTIMAGLDILISTKNRTRGSGYLRTLVQMAVIRLCRLEDLVAVSQVASWLGQAPAGSPAPRPAANVKATALPPEGKKKAEATEATPLTSASLATVWPDVLNEVAGMLGAQLQRAGMPAIIGPNALAVNFPPEYNSYIQTCSQPDNVERLEQALRQRTGQAWSVRFEKPTVVAASENGVPSAPPRERPQEVMKQVPILAKAMEVLDALPIKIDPGFGTVAAPAVAVEAASLEPDALPEEEVD